ncbi:hypothetical protein [Saccharopolyspora griseoalba]|uniref:Endonuclease/exonuclease/phosphatase domain-containing protein n=1 Tax=Saccharopolyspora griseoalba TaxID=1431848 RepID=A0ABW2LSC8_9PSEU
MIKAATYNVQDLYRTANQEHEDLVVDTIRQLRGDGESELVLAVQEVVAPPEGGPNAFARLAADTGLNAGPCARGHHVRDGLYHWVGLLWTSGVALVPGSIQTFDHDGMWHNLVVANVEVAGTRARVGSYHGSPFDQDRNVAEAKRIAAVYRFGSDLPGLIGADWNSLSADRYQRHDLEQYGQWELYDTLDPYRRGWAPHFTFQTTWSWEHGHRVTHSDRRAGDVLYSAGMTDARLPVRAKLTPTTGHHPDDPHGPRTIDRIHLTPHFAGAVDTVTVHDTPTAQKASDHLPAVVTLDPNRVQQ